VGELIGYARCSTVLQDLTAQREILTGLGVAENRIYLDKRLTGTNRARPGLDQALAAARAGDTPGVPAQTADQRFSLPIAGFRRTPAGPDAVAP
jgi:DNA invertase Pin-like site-specific DNA recombinase